MKKGIWIGLLTGLIYAFTNDLGIIIVALPLAIYIALRAIDICREDNIFLYRR